MYMYINQQDAQNSCDSTLFSIRCSTCLVYADTSDCCVAIATQQPCVPPYTKCDVQLIKVAPDDGLIQFETC